MKTASLQQKVEDQILDNYEAMYRLAYSYVRNEEDALDIVRQSAAGSLYPDMALADRHEYCRGSDPQQKE